VLALVAAAFCSAFALGGCGGNSGSSPDATPPSSTAPATPNREQVKAQVIAAWKAGHRAFAEAVRRADPNYPGLAKTAIDPQLSGVRSFVAAEKAAGDTGRGKEDLDQPHVTALRLDRHPQTATVKACVHGALILVDSKTGNPVPGKSGRVTWNDERTTLQHVEGVGWKVMSNDVQQGRTKAICGGS
jgi:hypothetical protein